MCANTRFCCLSSKSKSSESLNSTKNKEPVIVNIYDMCKVNNCISLLGIGIFHSGVEVYGAEYTYAGHDLPFTGIFEISPRQAHFLSQRFKYRESITVGYTDLTIAQIVDLIGDMGEVFGGERYHLFYHNCNHFTSTLSRILCGREIPKWINRLAKITSNIPFAHKILPTGWISPNSNVATKNTAKKSENLKKVWLKLTKKTGRKVRIETETSQTLHPNSDADAISTDDDQENDNNKTDEQKINIQKEKRNLTDTDDDVNENAERTNGQSERNDKKTANYRNFEAKKIQNNSANI